MKLYFMIVLIVLWFGFMIYVMVKEYRNPTMSVSGITVRGYVKFLIYFIIFGIIVVIIGKIFN